MELPAPVPAMLQALDVFAANVRATLAAGRVDWKRRPAPGAWSVTEVICHLRDVEREVHQPRFRAVLERQDAFLSGVDADEWADPRGYQEQDGPEALASFLAARAETVALLRGLPAEAWERRGRHAFFGSTRLDELLGLIVRHDEAHWEQLYELIATQPRDDLN